MTDNANSPVLHTERLLLRAPDGRDQDAYFEFAATDRARFIGGPMDDAAAKVAWGQEVAHWAMHGFGRFAVVPKDEDVAVGLIGPQHPMGWPEGEMNWFMFGTGEGKGYATEAGHVVRLWTYETLKWETMVSYMEPHNTRSIALAERLYCQQDPSTMLPGPDILAYRHPPLEVLK